LHVFRNGEARRILNKIRRAHAIGVAFITEAAPPCIGSVTGFEPRTLTRATSAPVARTSRQIRAKSGFAVKPHSWVGFGSFMVILLSVRLCRRNVTTASAGL